MKKTTKILAVFGSVLVAGGARALNPATFDITVNMAGTLSVAILSGAPVALGAVTPSSLSNNAAAVVVQNDSSGFVEDYRLSVANSAGGWSIGATAGTDIATLHAKFNTTVPGNTPLDGAGNFDADDQLIGGAPSILSGDTVGDGAFAGNMDGQDVPTGVPGNTNLWIRFGAPTLDMTGGSAQSFTVTIDAVNP